MKVKLKDGSQVDNGIWRYDDLDFGSFSFKTDKKSYDEMMEAIVKSYLPELSLLQRIKNKLLGGI